MTHETISRANSHNATANHTDFWAVVMFSTIGVLVLLNLMLRFPDLGAMVAQYNQF
jgi:hypothetical protein